MVKAKRKENPYTSLERPTGLQTCETLRISRKSTYVGDKVISLTHQPLLQTESTNERSWCGRKFLSN